MSILTPQQIAQYAYNAGFRGAALNQAVAVAIAESGGNTGAYNPEAAAGTKAGSGSRGLWQIYGSAHPQFNNSSAFDPQINANAAFQVFREAGNRFSPWSTFNQGLAVPRTDYASSIKGAVKMSNSPVAQIARGAVAPIQQAVTQTQPTQNAQTQNLGASATGQSTPASIIPSMPTIYSFLGIDKAKKSGQAIASDFIFTFLGLSFILIAIIALFVGGGSKVVSDNSEAAKAITKAVL
jgi:hypothetical protein